MTLISIGKARCFEGVKDRKRGQRKVPGRKDILVIPASGSTYWFIGSTSFHPLKNSRGDSVPDRRQVGHNKPFPTISPNHLDWICLRNKHLWY